MSRFRRASIVALGVAALAVPGAAIAKHDDSHGKAKGHDKNGKANGHRPHKVGHVFKGHYAGDGMVEVERGNAHVRKGGFIGKTVEFDLTGARIVTADVNGDGKRDLDDVASGDWVLVKARLPRTDPGDQPFEARRLIDKTSRHKVS